MTGPAGCWTWRLLGGDGEVAGPVAPRAASRFDSEAWLGAHWRVLAAAGVRRAVLLEDGSPVGPGVELREGTVG